MTLVAKSIPNLVSGVSQQPAPSRLATSSRLEKNTLPSVVSGQSKRPPSSFAAALSPSITVSDTAAVHMIDRSATEKYILVCGSGDLELYDETGVKQTVTFPNGKAYLPTTDMWKKLKFVTVADTTFISNNEQVVVASTPPDTRDDPSLIASVFIKQAVADADYDILIDDVVVGTFKTDTNTDAASALEDTTEIAEELVTGLISNGYATATNYGPVVSFPILAGEKLTVTDALGGNAVKAYTDTLQQFEDLPPYENNGRLVRLAGDLDDGSAAYWVSFADGIWTEDVGYASQRELDAYSMPHVLVKTGANTFEFRENTWNPRSVGDDDSNPDPSYVGSTINGMFLFKGRLGFLSEENVIMSATALFEDQYRTTVVQSIDTDPIDIASATGRVSTLYHAASFSDELLLFSDKQQFRLSAGNVLEADSVGIVNSTSYPCSTLVAPVVVGSSAYFVADGPTHTIAREVFVDGDRETVGGEDIAVQVPSYIPKNIRSLTASQTSDLLLAMSDDEPNSLYVYKWYTSERRRIQSAWFKWEFDENVKIIGTGFLGTILYLVYKVGSAVRFDTMNVSTVIDKDLLLDHQFTESDFDSFTYDAGTGLTTVVVPTSTPATFEFYNTTDNKFEPMTATKISNTTYTFVGDVTGYTVTAGLNYEFRYGFSTQYLREDTGSGLAPIQDGRLQLRYFSLLHTETSYYEVHVSPTNRDTRVSVFNGRTISDPDNLSDVIPKDTSEFRVPIFAENEEVEIDIVSSEPYPCSFSSVEWSAMYKPKARRV